MLTAILDSYACVSKECCYAYVLPFSYELDEMNYKPFVYLRDRSALAVNCSIIIHCLEVGCKEDQITSAQCG